MKKLIVQYLTKCALCALAVFAVTFFTGSAFRLPQGAYINIGDSVIYVIALLFPLGVSLPAAVIGAALADVAIGSTNYVIATIIIKALMVVAVKCVIRLSDKVLTQDLLVCFIGVFTVAGYFVADIILTVKDGIGFVKALSTRALEGAMPNILQALICAVIYLAISGIARRIADKKQKTETETETEVSI